MSRKPIGPSYANVTIGQVQKGPNPSLLMQAAPVAPPKARRTMRDESAPVTLYLHPAARKALKHYAIAQDVKVHDLLLDAVETWFKAHGLEEPVRVQSAEVADGGFE